MAKYRNSTFGTITGSIGDDTCSTWKGEKVLKKKASPANPQSPGQTAQRDKFFLCNNVGQAINFPILQTYWNYLFSKMSGFNAFIKENIKLVTDGSSDSLSDMLITKGNYEQIASIDSAVYDDSDGSLNVSWDTAPGIFGDGDDEVIVVAIDFSLYDIATRTGTLIVTYDVSKKRSDGSVALTLPDGLDNTNMIVFVGNSNPSDSTKMRTANSKNSAVTAA
jgi:hypothetical protein